MQRDATLRYARPLVVAAALTALAGCTLDGLGSAGPAATTPTAPPPDMAGRWMLSAAGGRGCAMNFGPPAQGGGGSIRPEGGCPGNFYTSRQWTFENGEIVIRDHNSAQLGQVRFASPGRFEGRAANGQLLTLTR